MSKKAKYIILFGLSGVVLAVVIELSIMSVVTMVLINGVTGYVAFRINENENKKGDDKKN